MSNALQQQTIVEDDPTGTHVETLKRAILDNLFYSWNGYMEVGLALDSTHQHGIPRGRSGRQSPTCLWSLHTGASLANTCALNRAGLLTGPVWRLA
jgi:hypothetical protein